MYAPRPCVANCGGGLGTISGGRILGEPYTWESYLMPLRDIADRSGTAPTLHARNARVAGGSLPLGVEVGEVRPPAFETVRAGQ